VKYTSFKKIVNFRKKLISNSNVVASIGAISTTKKTRKTSEISVVFRLEGDLCKKYKHQITKTVFLKAI